MSNDFILEFKYNTKNEWKVFQKSILIHFGMLACFAYYLLTKEEVSLFISLIFLIISIPQIILHLQYRLEDKNKLIKVNYSKSTITVEKSQKPQVIFKIDEIKQIIRKKGQKEEDNTLYVFPYCYYHYTKIILTNGEKIFFTDFISKSIALNNIEIKEKISILNIIK